MWVVKNINNIEYAFDEKPVPVTIINSLKGNKKEIYWCYPSYRVCNEELNGDTAFSSEEYLWDNWNTCAKVKMPEGSIEKLLGYTPEIDKPYNI